ncbi:MAG: class I SAM-dependent methyltransferase [Chloroflexota bacterium]|nr:class I SAM-dependent methyltransferase [Chloroflexota bacterium]
MSNLHGHTWGNADAYAAYMGRWSRPMAEGVLRWLRPEPGLDWLDVGCGTGALTSAILDLAAPGAVTGVDPSANFLDTAGTRLTDPRVQFTVATAADLPYPTASFDIVIAGLVLHLIQDPLTAVQEMTRVARAGGVVAAYVWDFTGERQFTHAFWNAAKELDPSAASFDPATQTTLCAHKPLAELLTAADLHQVLVESIAIPVVFRNFDDFWLPHLLQGSPPAQRYTATLDEPALTSLRERLRTTLPVAADGSLPLLGHVWAARGTKAP